MTVSPAELELLCDYWGLLLGVLEEFKPAFNVERVSNAQGESGRRFQRRGA